MAQIVLDQVDKVYEAHRPQSLRGVGDRAPLLVGNAVAGRIRAEFLRRIGLADLLHPATA